jgi:hypothetical protein
LKRLPEKIYALILFFLLIGPAGTFAQNINGTTGNYAFPQNRDNPYGIHSSVYNNQDIIDAYKKWYADCVTSSGAGGFLRLQRPNDSGLNLNSTVSEGIGYAMVIAVYMNDENLFDNIWKYEQLHLDGNKLMNWYIDASGATDGTGAATDADEDMAWALLMASRQWGGSGTLSGTYLNYAVSQINNIYATELNTGIPDGGDSFNPINASYFAPAYYREFASATGQTGWLTVAANCYTVLNNNLGQGYGNAANGLDSAWCTSAGVSTATNAAPYDYQYDACRTPFRMTEDYLWFGTPASQNYATLTSNFFSGVGAVSIVDGYYLNGTPHPHLPSLTVSQNPGTQSAAFVGPAGVGGMVNHNYQAFLDQAYQDLVGSKLLVGGTYYDESWTVMSLLMMSGNFLDYNLYTTPTPTPTLTAYAPLTIRVDAGSVTNVVDSAGATWYADQQFGGANTWGYDSTQKGSTSTYTSAITGAAAGQTPLYQTERWGNPLYRFTVPNGYYVVTLKFAENYDADSHNGGRVFSVAAEGQPAITNLDVYQTAGGEHKAYDVAVTLVVTDGELDLNFSSSVDSSEVDAIQVLRVATPPTPTMTATKTITPTNTPTIGSPTATMTGTPPTATATPTLTRTPTFTTTPSPTVTETLSPTATASASPTATLTKTFTLTPTPTSTPSLTKTVTATLTPTLTSSPTVTATVSQTVSATLTPSLTATASPTRTPTFSQTPTLTKTPTQTPSLTPSPTGTPSLTATYTTTVFPSATKTPTATFSATQSFTKTPTITRTSTPTPTASFTATPTASATPTPQATLSLSLSAAPSNVAPDDFMTYTIQLVVSNGDSNSTVLILNLPTGVTVSGYTTGPSGSISGNQVFWTLGTLTPGTYTFGVEVTVLNGASGTLSAQAGVSAPAGEIFSNSASVTVTPFTSTPTATAQVTPVSNPVLYPNPVSGPGPILIRLPNYLGVADIPVKVYTIAFRLVDKFTAYQMAGGSDVSLPLTDQGGTPLANGLYYVVVTTPENRSTLKLLIIR